MERFDVVVLGAGASGLFCARGCALRGRSVLVLDHAAQAARKVRISGGGRCNVTNLHASAADYTCANPHFVKSALARFTPWDMLDFLASRGVRAVEEDAGRMFCLQGTGGIGGAEAVAHALEDAAPEAGARLRLGVAVERVEGAEQGFTVNGAIACRSLVCALGGPAWPQVGATSLGFELARSFGLAVTPVRPGLVPLVADAPLRDFCAALAGTALPARVFGSWGDIGGEERGAILFTHKGLSGPAVLNASLRWRPGMELLLDLLPGVDVAQALADCGRQEARNALARLLPKRLANALCGHHGWRGRVADMGHKALQDMAETLGAWPFAASGTDGFARAEVCLGGVDTDALSSKTMEARAVPGLYFTGEVMDVAGRLGGYNLHWAWASGFAAGQHA